MRIVHTSDWHLGRQFGPISLRGDQEAFADWFVELVTDEGIDLVVIAGDLYERAIAPVDAIDLFRQTMGRILATGTVITAITGNHDGPDRVAPYAELLDMSGFYLRGGYQHAGTILTHNFRDGPLDIALIPFLDPQAAPDDFGADEPAEESVEGREPVDGEVVERRRRRTHESVLETAIGLSRSRLTARRSLAVGHAYVTGATVSDSERQLVVGSTVGGFGDVHASLFDAFSYTALGHLHRPQRIGVDESIRYSGSPLAYSFSEEHDKCVVVINMDASGAVEATEIPVPVGRHVRTIEGAMDELLDPGSHLDARSCFVRAVVTDAEMVLDAKARLAERYPHIVEVRLMPHGSEHTIGGPADVCELSPIDIAREFWNASQGSPPSGDIDAVLVEATDRAMKAAVQ